MDEILFKVNLYMISDKLLFKFEVIALPSPIVEMV